MNNMDLFGSVSSEVKRFYKLEPSTRAYIKVKKSLLNIIEDLSGEASTQDHKTVSTFAREDQEHQRTGKLECLASLRIVEDQLHHLVLNNNEDFNGAFSPNPTEEEAFLALGDSFKEWVLSSDMWYRRYFSDGSFGWTNGRYSFVFQTGEMPATVDLVAMKNSYLTQYAFAPYLRMEDRIPPNYR